MESSGSAISEMDHILRAATVMARLGRKQLALPHGYKHMSGGTVVV
jgi:hypothetical protein